MPGNIASFILGPFAAGSAVNVVAANTPAGAGNLALVGGGPVVLDAPRRVLITFGIEVASRIIKVSGTNAFNNAISEQVTIPSGGAGTKTTIQDFATVTQVAVFAAWSVPMSVGTQSAGGAAGLPVASTPWFLVDPFRIPTNIAVGVSRLDSSAALTTGYIIEGTFDDINAAYDPPEILNNPASINPQSNVPPVVYGDGAAVGNFTAGAALKKANFTGLVAQPFFALRCALYDTTPAQLSAQFMQSGAAGA